MEEGAAATLRKPLKVSRSWGLMSGSRTLPAQDAET